MRRIEVTIIRPKNRGEKPYFRWTDPKTGKRPQKTIKGTTQRQIRKEREELEEWLNARSNEMTWIQFFDRFCEAYLDDMSKGHQAKCHHMSKRLIEAASRQGDDGLLVSDVGPELVLQVEAEMRRSGIADATVRSNMGSLWAVLSWGMDARIVPEFRRPRQRKGKASKQRKRKSKGRALTLEEIERMEQAVPQCCKTSEPAEPFLLAMKAMRLIGLRRSEAWLFRWDPMEGAHYPVRLHGARPAICFDSDQKSGNEEEVPLTPDAAAWLRSIEKPAGWVCRTSGARGEHQTPDRLGRVLAEAGKKANIMVKKTGGKLGQPKFASAHDLRRTFATTWQQQFTLTELSKLTRHGDVNTLADYYADAPNSVIYEKLERYAARIEAEEDAIEDRAS